MPAGQQRPLGALDGVDGRAEHGHDESQEGVSSTDYSAVLLRAIAGLDRNTAEARDAVYERARRVLMEQLLRADDVQASASKPHAERAAFEAAVERIETEFAYLDRAPPGPGDVPDWQRDAYEPGVTGSASTWLRPAVLILLGSAAVLGILMAGYMFRMSRSTDVTETRRNDPSADKGTITHAAVRHAEELEPGIDGGSTDAGLPYYYRRQPVYYRTVYSLGTVLIDRSQRFIYLIQPNSVALRYGIGVGGECVDSAGLLRVTRKEEWPQWVPTSAVLERRSYPSRMAGGPGNPLGARVLYLNDGIGIHGTNAPKSIGHAVSLGCFRMVNDDVVDLYQRVPTGTGVVVMN
jgi:lipoprotein-anchoring transpeptidase ErfK/SrfK